MIKLPTIPIILKGVKYPSMELETQYDNVRKTNPKDYIRDIKYMIKIINEYRECLEYQGYKVENLETFDEDKIVAKKEVIIS